jgi:ABC-type nitrate/sulfonate/bicarbonate transport system substrate-binding protein
MPRSPRHLIACLAVGSVLAATACGSGGAGSADSGNGATITVVNGINSIEFLAADMAEKLGTWKKLGLTVKYVHGTGGGGQVVTTLAARQADLGLHGGGASAISIAKGLPAKIVAVTADSFAGMVCVVRKDSGIHSFDDLKGKTMGISSAGSLTDLVSRRIALGHGWKLGSDFKQAKIGDLSQLTAALDKGIIDLVCWSSEPAFTLVEKGQGRVLGNAGDVVGPNIYEAVIATDDAIKSKPDAIKKYLAGYFDAVKYMKAHPDETIKLLMQAENLTESVAKNVYDSEMANLSDDGTADPAQLSGLVENVKLLQGGSAPSQDAVWDPRFVPVGPAS